MAWSDQQPGNMLPLLPPLPSDETEEQWLLQFQENMRLTVTAIYRLQIALKTRMTGSQTGLA
jgi:hypothetical protein